jgi:transcriptional regulator GlxA family with amidase domain
MHQNRTGAVDMRGEDLTLPYRAGRHYVSRPDSYQVTHIDVVLFEGFALPGVATIIEIFQKANALVAPQLPGRTRYDISLLSTTGGRVASSSSVFVWTESVDSHRGSNNAHLLFIAGGTGAQQACRDERLQIWLRNRHPFSEIVHPIAEGRLLLEAAGLSSRAYSQIHSSQSRHSTYRATIQEEGRDLISSALHIVGGDLGTELAQFVEEPVVLEYKTPFNLSASAKATSQVSDKILASARWLEANVDQSISMDDAAQIAAMSERNFLRRFKSEMGMTPSDFLLHARLNLSCRMLIESRLPVDKVARRCGIGSGGHLARLFRKYLATTPTDYRMSRDALKNST